MDVRRATAVAGALAALLVALVVAAPPAAVGAGLAGALAAPAVVRGTPGVAAGSLALAAAAMLAASAAAAAPDPATALVSLLVAAGIAGCVAAAVGAFEDGESRERGGGPATTVPVPGGPVAALLGAWTAIVLPATAVLALLAATAGPFGSLLGSRLAVPELRLLLVGVPLAVVAVTGWAAIGAWRDARLPPWPFVAGPPALLVGLSVLASSAAGVDALLGGSLADAPAGYVLLWATATVLVASALAGAVAADDPRFRRGPAWAATGAGPLVLAVAVAWGDGGPFLAAALAVAPPAADAAGAVLETVPPGTATAFLAALSVSTLAFAATLPARAPLVGELTTGRSAGVGSGCLLAAVALATLGPPATALAGGLAVLSWVLLAAGPRVEPPPRTALSRAGLATLAVAGGSLLAVVLGGLVPPTDPGVGAALLLAGVTVLGLAIR